MIWFILGIAPFVIALTVFFIKDWRAFFIVVGGTAFVYGSLVLAFYGAWTMNWVEHCGNFWESYSCSDGN